MPDIMVTISSTPREKTLPNFYLTWARNQPKTADADSKRNYRMINVTRLNRSSLILNCDLIEYIEYTPDTVITLTNDRKITVQETAEEVVERIRAWRRSLLAPEFPAHTARQLSA
jgi:flagellar protein FlbD